MAAEPFYQHLLKILPQHAIDWINRYTDNSQDDDKDQDWKNLLTIYSLRLLVFSTLLAAIALGAQHYLLPYLCNTLRLPYGSIITAALTFIVMSPLLRAVLVNRAGNGDLFSKLWFKKRANHLPLMILVLGKMLVASIALYFVFHSIAGMHGLLACLAVLVAAYAISSSDWLMSEYLRIESRFLVNLNEKHMRKHRAAAGSSAESWFDEDLQLAYYDLDDASPIIGQSLRALALRESYGCNVLQLLGSKHTVDMPGGEQVVAAGDTLLIIGTVNQLQIFDAAIEQRNLGILRRQLPQSLRQFMLNNHQNQPEQQFLSLAITIDKHSPILGSSLKAADLRNKWSCLVIGLERGAFTITNPHVSLVFEENDLLWVLGKQKMMNTLIREQVL
jgi:monovalent cation:H+ antiporter-2, CPA2 family